jgi:glycerol-3-phosphate acyltransferase PlsY
MGHAFSVYYFYMKFRMKYINREKNMPHVFADGNTGGKAIAVSFGVMLGLYPDTMPLTILIACYLFFSLILRIKSHARRTIITFGSVIALSLFFVKEKSVIFGIIIISFIVIYKHVICTEKEKICES